ncbi:tyrosine-protein phosphatase [Henriciella aquimarina]|uniref:tyrosine-protein phosphatase n=1 Tax=Henriciella aquimarina TaxID=545261 RepID=UPI000A00AAA5|nr:tyrosine-protein phosphatase [Henriciella aquimarina]
MSIQKHVSAVSLAAIMACGLASADEAGKIEAAGVTDIAVSLDMESKVYSISWPSSLGEVARIEVAMDEETMPGNGKIIAEDLSASSVTWAADTLEERHYFLIVPEEGEAVRTALRLLPLEGGRNFRDLGGYKTEDGRTVKWGKLYRSGVMDGLTDEDYDYLSGLGIQVICDLRTARERAEEPTDWQAGQVEYLTFPDPEEDDSMSLMTVFQDPEVTPEKVSQAMAGAYADIAQDQVPAYREMFDRLAAGEVPLAFNCSAGKDRTGIGAALLLTALGVPRETVVADYALSEIYVDYMEEFAGDEAALDEDSPYAFLAKLPPEMVAPLMRSDPLYIETALLDMEEEYGSVLAFLHEEVEVTDEELEAIRAQLLH